jgi:hypothetical protein
MDVAIFSNKLNETSGYIVRPNFEEKFRSTKVQEILYSCISDVLGDKKFEQDSCPEWTKTSMLIDIPLHTEYKEAIHHTKTLIKEIKT